MRHTPQLSSRVFKGRLAIMRGSFRSRLAANTQAGPWDRIQALSRYWLLASFTKAVRAIFDFGESGLNIVDEPRLMIKPLDRHVSIGARPDLIKLISHIVDVQLFALAGDARDLPESRLQICHAPAGFRCGDCGYLGWHCSTPIWK